MTIVFLGWLKRAEMSILKIFLILILLASMLMLIKFLNLRYYTARTIASPIDTIIHFDRQQIPAGTTVLVEIDGMNYTGNLTALLGDPLTDIIFNNETMLGYDVAIDYPILDLHIVLEPGTYLLTASLVYEGTILSNITRDVVVPVNASVSESTASNTSMLSSTLLPIFPAVQQPTSQPASLRFFLIVIGVLITIIIVTSGLILAYVKKRHPIISQETITQLISVITQYRTTGLSDKQIIAQLRKYHSEGELRGAFEKLDLLKIKAYVQHFRAQGYSDSQLHSQLEQYFTQEAIRDAFKRL
ncbi:hypothetical protein HY488_02145 [Candidatus Woesearchaeota archaeon]|nr:hypothetical protein [Candidatus Woesearchaeota archaeon]